MAASTDPKSKRAPRPCPICNKMSVEPHHPFCSARCADIDLHRWLGGHYRLPSREEPDFSGTETPPEEDGES